MNINILLIQYKKTNILTHHSAFFKRPQNPQLGKSDFTENLQIWTWTPQFEGSKILEFELILLINGTTELVVMTQEDEYTIVVTLAENRC